MPPSEPRVSLAASAHMGADDRAPANHGFAGDQAEPFAGLFARQIMPAIALVLASALLNSAPAVPADAGAPPPRVSIVAACTAAAPAAGASFSGPVLQVLDGRTLCIAQGPTPDRWIQVRLADVHDREARGALMAAAFARNVSCRAIRRDGDGVVASCNLSGAPLGQVAGSDAATVQAASWR